MKPLRLGMVGGGQGAFIGAVHRMAARLDGQWQLQAGALSADPARARASATELGLDPVRAYADWREMARAESARPDGIDAVAVVTPNHLHAPVAAAFLEAGINVICDKPLATSLADARALRALARRQGRLLALTQTYSGYPMVRHARALVAAGELGELRLVQVEYAQDWLAEPIEQQGQKQAAWRCDPAQAGPAGALGDIGTHAYHLACFVSGQHAEAVCAELARLVPGRRLDDHVQAMLRFPGGVRGQLWASQVSAGCENGLRLRLWGSRAGLEFVQERPDELLLTPLGGPAQRLTRGRVAGAEAAAATRLPAGHPEGYLEAFGQIYRDAAEWIRARREGRAPAEASRWLTTADDGVAGLAFVEAVLASDRAGSAWVGLAQDEGGPV